MVVLAVCVFGWVSYQRLSLNLMPDISYPTLTVRTEYPGTAPEEVETLLSRPLEQELGIVPHLVNISSISKAGQSDIILEFEWDTDMNAMSQEIREKADRVWLPQDAEKPLLLRYDPSLDPIMRIGLHGPHDLYALRYLAEHEIKRELEALAGVAAVKIKGGLEEEIHVALNERQISVMGLDINQINNRLAQNNVNLPGGNLREGQVEYLIRTLNEFATVDEIAELIVARQGDADIYLRDIAEVVRSHKDREIITRVNGKESVEIEIYKEGDANIVAVAERVRNTLFGLPQQREYVEQKAREAQEMAQRSEEQKKQERDEAEKKQEAEKAAGKKNEEEQQKELQAKKQEEARKAMEHLRMTDFIGHRLPPGAKLELLSDQSGFIKNSISEVQISAIIGGTMAVLVLFVFLRNVVHTLIVGLTIPVSIMATFAPMYMFDVSLNIMSLGGLALGVGMLVDNSIVVLESIFRCREEGDDLIQATIRGTREVGTAVFASTLTTITVFFPHRLRRGRGRADLRRYGADGGVLAVGLVGGGAVSHSHVGLAPNQRPRRVGRADRSQRLSAPTGTKPGPRGIQRAGELVAQGGAGGPFAALLNRRGTIEGGAGRGDPRGGGTQRCLPPRLRAVVVADQTRRVLLAQARADLSELGRCLGRRKSHRRVDLL